VLIGYYNPPWKGRKFKNSFLLLASIGFFGGIPGFFCLTDQKRRGTIYGIIKLAVVLFSDNLKLSENSDYNCLSGKELANSLPDKLKSMEYINGGPVRCNYSVWRFF
jgi:hypothetical protein